MHVFAKIVSFIQHRQLKKLLKERSVKTEFHNLDSAKCVHLFFNAKNDENYRPAKAFISELKDRKLRVQAIGFVENDEQKAKFLFHKEVRFVSPKDLSRLGKPPKAFLEELNRERADIFLNLCAEENFTAQYIAAYSDAKFKVSGIADDITADFIIDVSKSKQPADMISQTKHFLSTIKKA